MAVVAVLAAGGPGADGADGVFRHDGLCVEWDAVVFLHGFGFRDRLWLLFFLRSIIITLTVS